MRRIICVLLTLALLSSLLGIISSAAQKDGFIYVTSLDSIRATGYSKPSLDVNASVPRVDDTSYKYGHSIVAHPESQNEPSYVEYDISAYSYTHFFSYLGKNADLAANTCVQFVVYADGAEIYKSDYIYIGQEPVACIAEIPSGTQKLLLEVNCGSDGIDYDSSVWGTPMLSDFKITKIEESRRFNKIQYDVGDKVAVKGGYFNATYSNGFVQRIAVTQGMVKGFDSSSEGERQLTVTYGDLSYTTPVYIGIVSAETDVPVVTDAPGKDFITDEETADATDTTAADSEHINEETGIVSYIIIILCIIVSIVAIVIVIKCFKRGKKEI